MGLKLIPNWKSSWKFSSVRASMLGIIFLSFLELVYVTWDSLPVVLTKRIPSHFSVSLFFFVIITLARITVWTGKHEQK